MISKFYKFIKERIYKFIPPFPVRVNGHWLYGASLRFFWTGHEREVYHLLHRVITKDMRVADVGACFGAHTATLLSLARKVVAFEPDPRAYWYLRKNFPNLEIVKAAVGMCCGETEFYLSKRIGTSSLKEKLKNHIQVRVVSLKDYGHFDFVKIDTEGCDIDVLKGLDKSKKARFTIEFAPKQFEDPQQFLDELKTLYVDYFYITPPELP